MKQILGLFFTLSFLSFSSAQIKLYVNGVEVNNKTQVKLQSIEKVEISFTPTNKVDTYTNGYGEFTIDHLTSNSEFFSPTFSLKFEGMSACDSWMQGNKKYLVYEKSTGKSDFIGIGNIYKKWENAQFDVNSDPLKLNIIATYRDKIGYEKYGTPIELVAPYVLEIDTRENNNYLPVTIPNAKINIDKANQLKFEFSRQLFLGPKEDNIFKGQEEYFSSFKSTLNTYNIYFMKSLVIYTKDVDQQMEGIKNSFIEEVIFNTQKEKRSGSFFNPGPNTLMSLFIRPIKNESQTNQWDFFCDNFPKTDLAFTAKKNINKNELYETITLGQLTGFKFNLTFNESSKNSVKTFTSLYILKDPKNPDKLILFTGYHRSSTTMESFTSEVNYVESVISALEF